MVLLAAGATVNQMDTNGACPLHIALKNSDTKMARLLLDGGADPVLPNNTGETALTIAKRRGLAEVVRLLTDFARFVDMQVEVQGHGAGIMKRAHRSLLGSKKNTYTVHFANGSIKKLGLEWHGGHLFSVVGSKTIQSLQRHRKGLPHSALEEPASPKVHMSRYTSSNPDQILMVRHSQAANSRRLNAASISRHGRPGSSVGLGGASGED